jgi:hypothetical protein
VDQTGNGTHKTIEAAIADGFKLIHVKPGTYTPDSLELEGVTLEGESPRNTIIQLAGGKTISLKGHDATNSYSTGSFSINGGSASGTGAATFWDSGANPPSGYSNPWIKTDNLPLTQIEDFPSDTDLNLVEHYQGDNINTPSYVIYDIFNHGSKISGFTIERSSVTPPGSTMLKINGMFNTVENCYFDADVTFTPQIIEVGSSYAQSTIIKHCLFNSGVKAINLTSTKDTVIDGCIFQHQSGDSLVITSATQTLISSNHFFSAVAYSIEVSTSDFLYILNNIFKYYNDTAIYFNDDSYDSQIRGNFFLDDGGNGSEIIYASPATLKRFSITHNIFKGRYCIRASVEFFSFSSNIIDRSGSNFEIRITGNNTTFANNVIFNRETTDVYISGSSSIISGNVADMSEDCRLSINLEGDYSSITNNVLNYIGIIASSKVAVCANSLHGTIAAGEGAAISVNNTSDHISITGNTINNGENPIHAASDYTNISDNIIDSSNDYGIRSEGAGCSVKSNIIYSPGSYGILAEGNQSNIADNSIISPTTYSITSSGQSSRVSGNFISAGTIGIAIENSLNLITDNLIISPSDNAIDLNSDADSATISNNLLSTDAGKGIQLDSGALGVSINGNYILGTATSDTAINLGGNARISISNNRIYQIPDAIVAVGSGRTITINNNHIFESTSSCITMTGTGAFQVNSNSLIHCSPTTAGIYINDDLSACQINNNQITELTTGQGILISDYLANGNLSICGNIIKEVSAGNGIQVNSDVSIKAVVSNNLVYNADDNGIFIDTTAGININDYNTLSGNHCHQCGDNGIYVKTQLNNINSNNCADNGTDGIKLDSAALRCTINSNISVNNGADGIDISGTDRCIIIGCVILGNPANQINQGGGTTNQVVAHNIVA